MISIYMYKLSIKTTSCRDHISHIIYDVAFLIDEFTTHFIF